MDPVLPNPVTTNDFYLKAILLELEGFRLLVEKGNTPPPVQVVYIALPDGFPGKDALEKVGIMAWEQVPYDGDALAEVQGIGKATAGQIMSEVAKHWGGQKPPKAAPAFEGD